MIRSKRNTSANNQVKEKLRLTGMDCADCATSIERSLEQLQGVSVAKVNFGASTAEVTYDPSQVSHDSIVSRINDLGYGIEEGHRAGRPLEFVIEGMDCADCAMTVEKAVAGLPGVQSATVDFGSGRMTVLPSGEAGAGTVQAIEHIVSEAGYRATPAQARERLAQIPFWRRERRVLTTGVGAALALCALGLTLMHAPAVVVNALLAAAIVVSGWGFARAGLLALRAGRADMNLLMTLAALGAAALGDWAEAATVVLLFAFGGTLQAYTLEKTRGAIRALMDLSPDTALVQRTELRQGTELTRHVRLPVEEVLPGEIVIVGPGERIPLDGVVLSGSSSVDQSAITGESIPVDVGPGSEVFAGTINGPGAFTMRTIRPASDTTLARIIHLVEESQARRATLQQFVDRFAAVYTPLVIAGAVAVAVVPPLLLGQPFAEWFYRALVLLVVACPCALVISTPVSIVAAIGAATRHGVLIKGGATLEALGTVRAIAFDKTGTLTEGRPKVVSVHALQGNEDELLNLAAAAEARSEHPLSRAIVHAARERRNGSQGTQGMQASQFTALPGMGARAEVQGRVVYVGNARLFREQGIPLDGAAQVLQALQTEGSTAVLVGTEDRMLGVIALADRPRSNARQAIERLRRAGIRHLALISGDNPLTAGTIARQVGVDEWHAELLPAEKVGVIHDLKRRYGQVAMVGDGVNDAPALAAADVGIAMGVAGTDVALEVADVVLMSDDLSKLDYAIMLSRKTLGIIKFNIALSLAAKAVALALAAVGALPIWGAIMADMGVSLLVTLNGMRLLAYRGD
jgi:Cd2+/Zn2+-exporting ATPase